ncbi:phosphotransferase [Actinomadura latina]|uniref:Phosphotransferase n=1 Tax=Actinomadura latina TaxID=163603 RepID=A0A846YYF5_9ACTN|nr:phosphotransferase [Actinomadura latina]NKZ04727.1 phosphotransferase [Actinomadura latina]
MGFGHSSVVQFALWGLSEARFFTQGRDLLPNDRFLTCREILRWHYGHRRPTFLGTPRRHYSLHYTYRHDDRTYLISKVRKESGRVPFSWQFAIMQAITATAAGSVVRSSVETRNGDSWVTGLRNRWFVRSYAEHDPAPDWLATSLVEDAARKLALVHRSADVIDRAALDASESDLHAYDWPMARVLGQADPLIANMVSRGRTPAHVKTVNAGLARLSAERVGLYLGPKGLTHHDLRTENLLVRDGVVTEIVDWDRAHWDVQWYDVALAGLHLAYLQPMCLRWDLTEAFVAAYQENTEHELTPEALGWLFRFTAVRNLAVSRSPEKWARLVRGVEERWGGLPSVFVGDFVAEDQVAADVDVAAEDGGSLGAVGVG